MGNADPHCHTVASDGMVTPAELVADAVAAGLDLIVVTDHDTMSAAGEVLRRGEEAGLAVVPGQEITTRWPEQTHLLGWFLDRPVKGGMSVLDTVRAIREAGGLAIVPHPFMPTYFGSIQPGALTRLLELTDLDGIEAMHTAPTTTSRRRLLERFCTAHADRLGALVGGSDSHFGRHDLGRVVTRFDGRNAPDFRRALEARTTEPHQGANRGGVPLALLIRQQRRSLIELPLRRLFGRL